MNGSITQFGRVAARLAIIFGTVSLLLACEGASDTDNNNNNNNNQNPGSQPTVNLGVDITLLSSRGLVEISAQTTNATHFEWTQISNGTTVNLMNADTPSVSFIPPRFSGFSSLENRRLTLRLTVTNDAGYQAFDDIIITVPPELQPPPGENSPPALDFITNVIAHPGQLVELTATATDDDGTPSFRWIQVTGPLLGLTTEQLNNPTISFLAPTSPSKIWFVVEATDNNGGRDIANVLVEVVGNIPPIVSAGGDITTTSGELVTITGSASNSTSTMLPSFRVRPVEVWICPFSKISCVN